MDKAQQTGLGSQVVAHLGGAGSARYVNKTEAQWPSPPAGFEVQFKDAESKLGAVSLPELHEQAIANLDELEVMVAKLETRLKGVLRAEPGVGNGAQTTGPTPHPPLIETQYTINRRIAAVRNSLASIEGRVAL